MVDLGCFDGGFTNRIGLAGHKVLGVDLFETSVALTNRKAAEFNTGAHHVIWRFEDALVKRIPEAEPGTFDALTCTDTWEHVRDVDVLVRLGARYLRDGGRFLLTTPHGAWRRGRVIDWAHPWRYGADKGKPWISDEPRAHLIAPTPADVAVHFRREDGWSLRHCYVIDSPCPDTPARVDMGSEADVTGVQLPDLAIALEPLPDDGPVLIQIEYQVVPEQREAFLRAIHAIERSRRRNGAESWRVFRDLGEDERFVERLVVDSWAEFVRLRSRMTVADRELIDRVAEYQSPGTSIRISRFIGVRLEDVPFTRA